MKSIGYKNLILIPILMLGAYWVLGWALEANVSGFGPWASKSPMHDLDTASPENWPSRNARSRLFSVPLLDEIATGKEDEIVFSALPEWQYSGGDFALEYEAQPKEGRAIESASFNQLDSVSNQKVSTIEGMQELDFELATGSEEPTQSLWGTEETEDGTADLTTDEGEQNELEIANLPSLDSPAVQGELVPNFFLDPEPTKPALTNSGNQNIRGRMPATTDKPYNLDPNWWVKEVHKPQLKGRNALRMTLDEVVFVALQNAPQIQIFNAQPRIQQTVIGETDADFDWTNFITTTYEDTNQPVASSLTVDGGAVGQRFLQREWAFEAGLRKQLRNGASVSLGQEYGTLDNNSEFLVPPNQGTSRLVLDYRQPLLQGRGSDIATSQVAIANLDLDTISNQALADVQSYMLEVVGAYWNLYLQRAVLIQNRRSMERAWELFNQLKLRDGIDVRNDQLLRAEAALAARRSEVIRAEYELINAQDRLINLVMGANSTHADFVELMPDSIGFPIGVEFASENVIEAAIHNRPEVKRAVAQIRSGNVRLNLAKNQLLPRLDAVISSTVAGLRGNKDIGGSFTDQFSTGAPSYSVGFEYELPFGNRAARNRIERSQLEAEVFYQEFQKEVGDVVLDARISSRKITRFNKENKNNWFALQKAAEELRLIHERQRLNLDDGKTGSLYIEDLLASQARLTAAEARLAQSQTAQAVAMIELKRATGELLRNYDSSVMAVSYSPILPDDFSGQAFGFPGVNPIETVTDSALHRSSYVITEEVSQFPNGMGHQNYPVSFPNEAVQNNPLNGSGSFGYAQ